MDKAKVKYKFKVAPKPDSKVKRIATTGIVLDFKKGPIVVDPKVLENNNIKNAVDILEKVPVEPETQTEKKESPQPGDSQTRKKGGK